MLSRRAFLRLLGGGALVAAGGWLLSSPLGRLLNAAGQAIGGPARGTGRTARPPGDDRPAGVDRIIALLSDTHVQDPATAPAATAVNGKVKAALTDLAAVAPDLVVITGDAVDNGLPGEYLALGKLLAERPGGTVTAGLIPEVAATTGNHEFYDPQATDQESLARFCQHFGQDRPYRSLTLGDLHLVLLADEMRHRAPRHPEWAWLTTEQVAWLRQDLRQHRRLDTVICLHQPLPDTVAWSYGGSGFAGCGQAAELTAILRDNRQVKLWLSGHTHLPLETPGQVHTDRGVTYAALGSTFYQFALQPAAGDASVPGRGGWAKDFGASQSRVLEVYSDRLRLRARDHVRQAWLDDLTVEIPRNPLSSPP